MSGEIHINIVLQLHYFLHLVGPDPTPLAISLPYGHLALSPGHSQFSMFDAQKQEGLVHIIMRGTCITVAKQ